MPFLNVVRLIEFFVHCFPFLHNCHSEWNTNVDKAWNSLSRNLLPLLAAEDERKLYKDYEREEFKKGEQTQMTLSMKEEESGLLKCNCMYSGLRQPIAPAVLDQASLEMSDPSGQAHGPMSSSLCYRSNWQAAPSCHA